MPSGIHHPTAWYPCLRARESHGIKVRIRARGGPGLEACVCTAHTKLKGRARELTINITSYKPHTGCNIRISTAES